MTEPYYADEHIALYLGDFRDLLTSVLGDTEPDLVMADPPYGETSLHWDRWPVGWPALAPGRSMWCFGSMRMFMDRRDEFAGWRMSQDIVWRKANGSGAASDRFRRAHEHAVHWYRGDWGSLHHDTPRVASRYPHRSQTRFKGAVTHWGPTAGPQEWVDDGTRLRESVIDAPNMFRRSINETEKPVGLIEPLVQYGCPASGLVVDLFSGSSSALVAARSTGRRAIGFELRETQCEKAARRLSQGDLFAGLGDAS